MIFVPHATIRQLAHAEAGMTGTRAPVIGIIVLAASVVALLAACLI